MDALKDKNNLIILGRWTKESLNHLLQESSNIHDTGERIEFVSKKFLGVDYRESTLIGDINRDEIFVVNLEGMDCMTFIEYVEAMRLSGSFPEFLENLKRVRYSQAEIAFENRNHFFTDWINTGDRSPIRAFGDKLEICPHVEDVTAKIGGSNTKRVKKRLNLKPVPEGFNRGKDGAYILPGISCKDREIKYIPADAVDDTVLDKLKTGDYVGMYSLEDGLDVSHVGIIIKTNGTTLLRHASSLAGKVIDEDLKKYIEKKEGLIVLRSRSSSQNYIDAA